MSFDPPFFKIFFLFFAKSLPLTVESPGKKPAKKFAGDVNCNSA